MSKEDYTKGIKKKSAAFDEGYIRDIQMMKKRLEAKLQIKLNDARFTHWLREQEAWRDLPRKLDPRTFK